MLRNLPKLEAAYPEYTEVIANFAAQDGLRRARWALDQARLAAARDGGADFVLLVTNMLEGGTVKAIKEIEALLDDSRRRLTLRCLENGLIELAAERPLLQARFAADEMEALFGVLDAAAPGRVMVHQLLGYPVEFVRRIGAWAQGRNSFYYVHDFYPLCPRVTMIDAIGQFCDVANTDTCARCVKLGGSHFASRLTELTPAAHRALFAEALWGFDQIIAPSPNTVWYMQRGLPGLTIEAIPHPEPAAGVAAAARGGSDDEVVLFGALGLHKGSAKLLEIAGRARLSHPKLKFRVIGYTDRDAQLAALGNVIITGRYEPEELDQLVAQSRGRLALFLQSWPETYSYTLSEAAGYGFIPLVPNIGAPAERVRASGFGMVLPFPLLATQVLETIDEIKAGRVTPYRAGALPKDLYPKPDDIQKTVNVLKNGYNALQEVFPGALA